MNASVLYTQNIKLNWEEKVITLWHYQEPGEGEEDWKLDPPSAALHCMWNACIGHLMYQLAQDTSYTE